MSTTVQPAANAVCVYRALSQNFTSQKDSLSKKQLVRFERSRLEISWEHGLIDRDYSTTARWYVTLAVHARVGMLLIIRAVHRTYCGKRWPSFVKPAMQRILQIPERRRTGSPERWRSRSQAAVCCRTWNFSACGTQVRLLAWMSCARCG